MIDQTKLYNALNEKYEELEERKKEVTTQEEFSSIDEIQADIRKILFIIEATESPESLDKARRVLNAVNERMVLLFDDTLTSY